MASEPLRLIVVTGLSGSGKSTAIHVLEDLGFYCIDNLPVALIPRLIELFETARQDVRRVTLDIDVREGHFLDAFPKVFDELRAANVAFEVLYLEASDEVLVRRFSETRRPHPAAGGGVLADGIRRERDRMRGFRVYFREQASQNLYGGVAPCADSTSRPEIDGVTCPIGMPPPPGVPSAPVNLRIVP